MANPRVLLIYPRLQFREQDIFKPDGSLSFPYLAGALRTAGIEVRILDASVGTDRDDLQQMFYSGVRQETGLVRIGMTDERLLEEVRDFNIIGITSIFTMQTRPVLEMIRLIRSAFPDKLIVSGGVNARELRQRFFSAGCDLVCLSEADETIVQIARTWRQSCKPADFSHIPGLTGRATGALAGPLIPAFHKPLLTPVADLDKLPMPAWDLLPNTRYWEISRPHGGDFAPGTRIQYASMMTSRGCPFACSYCHISKETADHEAGPIGTLRLKSVDRVMEEARILKELGVEYLFIEDDSLLAKKKRVITIFERFVGMGFKIIDVNGVNLAHLSRREGARLVVDQDMLDAMAAAGFTKLTLPFESGSQRILDKWASRKWRIDDLDCEELIRGCRDRGITPLGNYTIGYPDEPFDEMMETITMAQRHVNAGLAAASFFVIVPFPGTALFDLSVRDGHLDADFEPDLMNWTRSCFKNTPVPASALELVRATAWKLINRPEFVQSRVEMSARALAK